MPSQYYKAEGPSILFWLVKILFENADVWSMIIDNEIQCFYTKRFVYLQFSIGSSKPEQTAFSKFGSNRSSQYSASLIRHPGM